MGLSMNLLDPNSDPLFTPRPNRSQNYRPEPLKMGLI